MYTHIVPKIFSAKKKNCFLANQVRFEMVHLHTSHQLVLISFSFAIMRLAIDFASTTIAFIDLSSFL